MPRVESSIGTVEFQGRVYADLGDLVVAFQRSGDLLTASAIDQILIQMQAKRETILKVAQAIV